MTEPFDFNNMLSGIAADEPAIMTDLRADLQAEGSTIANLSPYSPFFRLLAVLVAKPLLALRDAVIGTILPGLFIRTATGAALDLRADGYDETRKAATAAKGNLTFYRAGTSGALTIPGGTVVESPPIDGTVYKMITDADTDIPDGNQSAAVAATAETSGAGHNLGDGYYSVLPAAPAGVTAVANEAGWLTTPGTDAETDTALRARLRAKVGALGQGTHGYYKNEIAGQLAITTEEVFEGVYGARGFGSRDYYALLSSGNPTGAQLAALNTHLGADGNHLDGDDVECLALPGLAVNQTVRPC